RDSRATPPSRAPSARATITVAVTSASMMAAAGAGGPARADPPPFRSGLLEPLRVGEALGRVGLVRERVERRDVAAVDAVAERDLVPLEEAGHHLLRDVDHVVVEPAAVRAAAVVAADHAHAADLARGGNRDRVVQPQQIRDRVAREVEALD